VIIWEAQSSRPLVMRAVIGPSVGPPYHSNRTGFDAFTRSNLMVSKLFYSYQDPPATGPVSMPLLVALYVLLMQSFAMIFPTSAAFPG